MSFPEASSEHTQSSDAEASKQRAAEVADALEALTPDLREVLHKAEGSEKLRIGRQISYIASILDAYKPEDFR